MRLRTPLLLLAVAAALFPGTAHAAVPQRLKPDYTLACGKKAAHVWNTGSKVAAKNKCRQWLVIRHWTSSQSNPSLSYISVAPGAHFNWPLAWNDIGEGFEVSLASAPHPCGHRIAKNSHGKNTWTACDE